MAEATTKSTAKSAKNVTKPIKWSPTRLLDYKKCPFLYKTKYIDLIKFPAGIDAFRGSVVHEVLEALFKSPQIERTEEKATSLVEGALDKLLLDEYYSQSEEIAALKSDSDKKDTMINEAKELIHNYFILENPSRLQAAGIEKWVEAKLHDGPMIGGFIDRLEISPTAGARIVDYKTGKKPDIFAFEESYIFQMLFYSLIYMKNNRGDLPKQIKLLYLKNCQETKLVPTDEEMVKVENEVRELVLAVEKETDWKPKRVKLCSWCAYKDICMEKHPDLDAIPDK